MMMGEAVEPAHDFGELPDVPGGWHWVDGHPFPNGMEVLSQVPPPRHKWSDVLVCDQCGRAWLIRRAEGSHDG